MMRVWLMSRIGRIGRIGLMVVGTSFGANAPAIEPMTEGLEAEAQMIVEGARGVGTGGDAGGYYGGSVLPKLVGVLPELTAQRRDRDVFGVSQRGDLLGGVADAAAGAVVVEDEKPTLATALQYLPVAGLDPGNREFFVGARSIFEGDTLVLNHAGEQFTARVVGVRNRQITMEDVESGLRASIRIDLVPPGEDEHPAISPMGR